MGELIKINGRTPEEIKRWVDGRATCNTCPKEHEVGCEDGERTEDCQMTIDTLAYIERLESERDAALAKAPTWISVKERLPEMYEDGSADIVLVTDGQFIHMAAYSNEKWYFAECGEMKEPMFYKVTHWMPTPKPANNE